MSKTFCPMPFLHLNLKQEGKVCACWRNQTRLGNSLEQSLLEIYNSKETKQLRQQLYEGVQAEGCKSCWDMEKSGITSTRQNALQDWKEFDKSVIASDFSMPVESLKSVEIRFDNVCNLMCRHCSPVYSSLWEQNVKKDLELLDSMKDYGINKDFDYHISINDKILDDIERIAPYVEELVISGGEPLYHAKHYEFLERLQPWAHKITLNYNSNLSTLEYKGKSVIPLWKNFKEISLLCSIDATKELYPYVRVNGNIDKVEKNIKIIQQELDNCYIQATCTTSVLNVTRLAEVVKYFISLKVGVHVSLVQYPRALNPKILPLKLKEKVNTDWNNFIEEIDSILDNTFAKRSAEWKQRYKNKVIKRGDYILTYMNAENAEDEWHKFYDFIKHQDKFHSTDVLEVYPEFKDYIDV